MKIIVAVSTYSNIENIGNEIVYRNEEFTTFIPESKEDAVKLKAIVEQFLDITNVKEKEDD